MLGQATHLCSCIQSSNNLKQFLNVSSLIVCPEAVILLGGSLFFIINIAGFWFSHMPPTHPPHQTHTHAHKLKITRHYVSTKNQPIQLVGKVRFQIKQNNGLNESIISYKDQKLHLNIDYICLTIVVVLKDDGEAVDDQIQDHKMPITCGNHPLLVCVLVFIFLEQIQLS